MYHSIVCYSTSCNIVKQILGGMPQMLDWLHQVPEPTYSHVVSTRRHSENPIPRDSVRSTQLRKPYVFRNFLKVSPKRENFLLLQNHLLWNEGRAVDLLTIRVSELQSKEWQVWRQSKDEVGTCVQNDMALCLETSPHKPPASPATLDLLLVAADKSNLHPCLIDILFCTVQHAF